MLIFCFIFLSKKKNYNNNNMDISPHKKPSSAPPPAKAEDPPPESDVVHRCNCNVEASCPRTQETLDALLKEQLEAANGDTTNWHYTEGDFEKILCVHHINKLLHHHKDCGRVIGLHRSEKEVAAPVAVVQEAQIPEGVCKCDDVSAPKCELNRKDLRDQDLMCRAVCKKGGGVYHCKNCGKNAEDHAKTPQNSPERDDVTDEFSCLSVANGQPPLLWSREPVRIHETIFPPFDRTDLVPDLSFLSMSAIKAEQRDMTVVTVSGESGIGKTVFGGVTMFNALCEALPEETIVYLGATISNEYQSEPRSSATKHLPKSLFENLSTKTIVFLHVDEWQGNVELVREFQRLIVFRFQSNRLRFVLSLTGFPLVFGTTPTHPQAVSMSVREIKCPLPHIDRTSIQKWLKKKFPTLPTLATNLLTNFVSGNLRCLRTVVDVLHGYSSRHTLTALTTRKEILTLYLLLIRKHQDINHVMRSLADVPKIRLTVWRALCGLDVLTDSDDVQTLQECGFASISAVASPYRLQTQAMNAVVLNPMHVLVVLDALKCNTRIFDQFWINITTNSDSPDSFEDVCAFLLAGRIVCGSMAGIKRVKVAELFRGFALSQRTGEECIVLPEECFPNTSYKLHKMGMPFPQSSQELPKGVHFIKNAPKAPFADIIIRVQSMHGSHGDVDTLLVQVKWDASMYEQNKTGDNISKNDVLLEVAKVGIELIQDDKDFMGKSAPKMFAKVNNYVAQRKANETLGKCLFVFMTDKTLSSDIIDHVISHYPVVIMHAGNTQLCSAILSHIGVLGSLNSLNLLDKDDE